MFALRTNFASCVRISKRCRIVTGSPSASTRYFSKGDGKDEDAVDDTELRNIEVQGEDGMALDNDTNETKE